MNEFDFLQQYTDAAKDSANRTRQILLVLMGASLLMSAAFWNSRASGWANARLALARATEHILSHEEERKKNSSIGEFQVPPGQELLYAKAKESISQTGRTLYQAQQNLILSQRIRGEQIAYIQAPIPGLGGVNFDVNDLAMFGGFTLLILLMWEYYSLWHYVNNLKLALDFARDIGANELGEEGKNRLLYHTYQNLAMRQVFTIPPRPATSRGQETNKLKALIRKAPQLMYAVPLIVQTFLVANDWSTFEIGLLINPSAATTVLLTGAVIWFIIVGLTVLCFYMLRKAYNTWQEVAETI